MSDEAKMLIPLSEKKAVLVEGTVVYGKPKVQIREVVKKKGSTEWTYTSKGISLPKDAESMKAILSAVMKIQMMDVEHYDVYDGKK